MPYDKYDKRKLGRLLGIGIVSLAALLLLIAALQVDLHPRTDDATVRANAIAFAPEVEGRLVKLAVQDNQIVHKGDVLFVIDPRPYEYALAQAKADQASGDSSTMVCAAAVPGCTANVLPSGT